MYCKSFSRQQYCLPVKCFSGVKRCLSVARMSPPQPFLCSKAFLCAQAATAMSVKLCLAMAALALAQPSGPPPPHPGANNLAQALWLYLQGNPPVTVAPGPASTAVTSDPPADPAPVPATSSTPGAAVPEGARADGPPPWRRSRSAAPTDAATPGPTAAASSGAAAAAPPLTPAAVAPAAVGGRAAPEPASASTPVVVVDNTTTGPAAANRPGLKLALRFCRVCREVAYQGKSVCLNENCAPWIHS